MWIIAAFHSPAIPTSSLPGEHTRSQHRQKAELYQHSAGSKWLRDGMFLWQRHPQRWPQLCLLITGCGSLCLYSCCSFSGEIGCCGLKSHGDVSLRAGFALQPVEIKTGGSVKSWSFIPEWMPKWGKKITFSLFLSFDWNGGDQLRCLHLC